MANAAIGVAGGGWLSWLNFRWLAKGVGALLGPLRSTAGAGASYALDLRPFSRAGNVARLVLYVILTVRGLSGRASVWLDFSR